MRMRKTRATIPGGWSTLQEPQSRSQVIDPTQASWLNGLQNPVAYLLVGFHSTTPSSETALTKSGWLLTWFLKTLRGMPRALVMVLNFRMYTQSSCIPLEDPVYILSAHALTT